MHDNIWDALASENYVVLDTETTGLDGEVCQVGIIDATGKTLLDILVKPVHPIPEDATRVHGITNDDVADALNFGAVRPIIINLISGRDVIVYNATFDRKLLHLSAEAEGLPKVDYKGFSRWHCAMEAFAPIYGEYNAYYGTYRWKSLSIAAAYFGIEADGAHTAIADCRTTLAVCKAMLAARAAEAGGDDQ